MPSATTPMHQPSAYHLPAPTRTSKAKPARATHANGRLGAFPHYVAEFVDNVAHHHSSPWP
jgi:hypothetical protein